jgi:hypothetical protein
MAIDKKSKRSKLQRKGTKSETDSVDEASSCCDSEAEIEELQKQLGKFEFRESIFDVSRTEWTFEEDIFIMQSIEIKKLSAKKVEHLYHHAKLQEPSSFTKELTHEDLARRHEDLKSPEMIQRQDLLLRLAQYRCEAEDKAVLDAEVRRSTGEAEVCRSGENR